MLHAVKIPHIKRLLEALAATGNVKCLRAFVQLHGVNVLKTWLKKYPSDIPILRMVLKCLDMLPFQSRNVIEEKRLDTFIHAYIQHTDDTVRARAQALHARWEALTHVYVIPKAVRAEVRSCRSFALMSLS